MSDHTVVISYASEDEAVAGAVCEALEGAGTACWIASRDVVGGAVWSTAIIEAIARCRVVVVILSSRSNASTHVRREVETAIHEHKLIIPIRIEDIEPTSWMRYFLAGIQRVEAVGPPLSSHFGALILAVRSAGKHSEVEEPPPVRRLHPPRFLERGATFDAQLLRFDLIVHNPGAKSIHLLKVGVRTYGLQGRFAALGISGALGVLADYVVPFHVRDPEHIQLADPPVLIGPAESVRFTVSLSPDTTGASTAWSTDVSAVVIFEDGTELETGRYRLTSADVAALKERRLTVRELPLALKHRDPGTRARAVRAISTLNLDIAEVERLLAMALSDEDWDVRTAAAETIGRLSLQQLAPLLAKRLDACVRELARPVRTGTSEEIANMTELLARFRYRPAVDSLIAAHVHPGFFHDWDTADALVDLRDARALHDIRVLVASLIGDTREEDEHLMDRVGGLAGVLARCRDLESVELLSALIRTKARVVMARSVLLSMQRGRLGASDPFVDKLRPALEEAAARSTDSIVRERAREILSA